MRELNYKCENKNSRNILPLFINEKLVPPNSRKRNTISVHAKLLDLEDLSLQALTIPTWSRQYITANISLKPVMIKENTHLFNDLIYS